MGKQQNCAKEKISLARARLVIAQPFFASLLSYVRVVPGTDGSTFWTNGRTIYYNEEFVVRLSERDIAAILAHEVMHAALRHPWRAAADPRYLTIVSAGGETTTVANIAGDAIVNALLQRAGMRPVDFQWLRIEEIETMALEEACEYLLNNLRSISPDEVNCAIVGQFSLPGRTDSTDNDDHGVTTDSDQAWRSRIIMAAQTARACGSMPAGLERFIAEYAHVSIDWRDVLARYLSQSPERSDYSFARPSRRSVEPFILPSQSVGRSALNGALVSIDMSGSVSDNTAGKILNECRRLADLFGTDIDVCSFDVSIYGPWKINEIPDGIPGGGGTSYREPQQLAERGDYTVHIIITDGYCHDAVETRVPTLWVIVDGDPTFRAPSGEVVYVDKLSV